MGPEKLQGGERGHRNSPGCAAAAPRAPGEESATEESAAQREAQKCNMVADSSVGALSEIYATLAVQAAQIQGGLRITGPEMLEKAKILSVGSVGGGDSPGCWL